MRALLLVGIIVAVGFGGCTAVRSENESRTSRNCTRDFSEGFRAGADADLTEHFHARRFEAAVAEICRELEALERVPADEESERWVARILAQRPEIVLPLCQVVVDASVSRDAPLYRFATRAEISRFRSRHCRLAALYLETSMSTAATRASTAAEMTADHPEVYVPLCASAAEHGMEELSGSFTLRQIRSIARRSCVEAIRTGVVTFGIPGLVNTRFDGARWGVIVKRVMREIASGTPAA